jgi:hypothetical protein
MTRLGSLIWFARPVAPLFALWYLGLGRIRFGKSSSEEIFSSLQARRLRTRGRKPTADELENMRWALAAVAARVPWRADCLVQVLAADRWLSAFDISTQAHLGVRDHNGQLSAHSWLTAEGIVVTGPCDVGDFHELPLAPPSSQAP